MIAFVPNEKAFMYFKLNVSLRNGIINCFIKIRLSLIYGPLFETAAYFSIELPEQNCYILEQYSNHRYGLIFLRDNSCLIQITCSVASISIRCTVNFQNDKV